MEKYEKNIISSLLIALFLIPLILTIKWFDFRVDAEDIFFYYSILIGLMLVLLTAYLAWDRYLGHLNQIKDDKQQYERMEVELKEMKSRISKQAETFNDQLRKLQPKPEPKLKSLLDMIDKLSSKRETAYGEKGQLLKDTRSDLPKELLEAILLELSSKVEQEEE